MGDISLRICVDTDVVLSTTVGWWELTRLGTIVGPPCIKKLQSKWCRCSILNSCVQGQAHGLPKIVVILPVLLTGPLSEYSMALTPECTRRATATSPKICLFMAISGKSSKCFDDVMTTSLKPKALYSEKFLISGVMIAKLIKLYLHKSLHFYDVLVILHSFSLHEIDVK